MLNALFLSLTFFPLFQTAINPVFFKFCITVIRVNYAELPEVRNLLLKTVGDT